jgi:gamma-glutamylcyclotransferase (GGCT)/AIG2-like uncharacterized protein YtfP
MEKNNLSKLFFVYGTLRPCIKADWSKSVHENENFKLKYYNAKLYKFKLYYMKKLGYPTVKFTNNENDYVIGDIIESTNYEETLKLFDEIEGFPNYYNRISTNSCFNICQNEFQNVWIYYFNQIDSNQFYDENENEEVKSCDYLDFNKNINQQEQFT